MPSVFNNRPSSLSIGSYFSLKKMKEDFVIIIIVLVLFILVVIVAVMQWFIDICRLCVHILPQIDQDSVSDLH
jgi:flagellar basal body-associated protein FliL